MSSRRKPPTLDYATASRISLAEKLAPFRWLFWPVGAVAFLLTFLGLAGNGAAAGVYEAIVHLPVLAAWLLSAYGWGCLLSSVGRTFFSVSAVVSKDEGGDRQECLSYQKTDSLVTVTTLAVGLGAMSLAILGLGLTGAFNRPVAIAMVLIGVVIAVVAIVKRKPKLTPHVGFAHWPWLLMTPSLAMVILCALLPAGLLWGMDEPNGYDVVEYHLQVPREWYEAGHIFALHHNVYSFFPFNVEMHYLLAMQLMGGPWAGQFLAQLMHAAYMALFVVAVYATVRPWGQGRAMIAALLAAAPPWVPLLASIAYDEGGLLLYGTLAIGWAMRVLTPSRGIPGEGRGGGSQLEASDPTAPTLTLPWSTGRGDQAIAGVMAGLACGCKLTAVPLILVGIPIAAMLLAPRQWKGVAIFCLAGLLTFSPWLIRNAVWARGNPVFPEMQSVLGRAHFSQEQSDRWYRAHKPRPDQQAMSVRVAELGRQVFADWRFGYVIVPLGTWMMLVAIRRPGPRMLLILTLFLTAFWLLQTHLQGRFYVLAIPIAALAIALVPRRGMGAMLFLAAAVFLFGTGASLVRIDEMKETVAKPGFGLMDTVGFTGIDRSEYLLRRDGRLPKMPIVLVGDAEAFLYQVPMTQLHYRTIFDVDMSAVQSFAEAWTADIPPGTSVRLQVNAGEIVRFQKTYGLGNGWDGLKISPEPLTYDYTTGSKEKPLLFGEPTHH